MEPTGVDFAWSPRVKCISSNNNRFQTPRPGNFKANSALEISNLTTDRGSLDNFKTVPGPKLRRPWKSVNFSNLAEANINGNTSSRPLSLHCNESCTSIKTVSEVQIVKSVSQNDSLVSESIFYSCEKLESVHENANLQRLVLKNNTMRDTTVNIYATLNGEQNPAFEPEKNDFKIILRDFKNEFVEKTSHLITERFYTFLSEKVNFEVQNLAHLIESLEKFYEICENNILSLSFIQTNDLVFVKNLISHLNRTNNESHSI